jgi:hypothetical protein
MTMQTTIPEVQEGSVFFLNANTVEFDLYCDSRTALGDILPEREPITVHLQRRMERVIWMNLLLMKVHQ